MKKKTNGLGAMGAAQLNKAFQKKQNERMNAIMQQKEQEKRERELREQQAREAEAAAEAQRRKEKEKTLNPVRERTLSTKKKSSAKAAGLKSSFILASDKLLMTSFGKGNDAIVEKRISGGRVETLAETPAFSVLPEADKAFRIDGRVKDAYTDNPLHTADASPCHPDDLIHAKAALETQYFGKAFDSNLHIQLIYNILDIEKILVIHANNIVYSLNNFLRQDGEDREDLIGYITLYPTYESFMAKKGEKAQELQKLFDRLCSARQLGYLNLEVVRTKPQEKDKPKRSDPNTIKLTEEEFFNVLYALGTMRQMLAHGNPYMNIYTMEGYGKNKGIGKVLDRLYQERVKELNDHFLDKARKNLALLFKAFGITDIAEKGKCVRDYYKFTVRKEYKNQGFSIKLLREHMTADIEEAFVLRDKVYDTVRGKLYPFIDFAMFRYYQAHLEEAEALVGGLRASFNEVEKDDLYTREAARIWPKLRRLILDHILKEMTGQVIEKTKPDPDVKESMLSDPHETIKVEREASDFSKLIYLVTLFINGKEINDLLTTLIHKLENIAAFLDVIKSQGLPDKFVPEFQIFSRSGKIASELRVINSFARMSKPSAKAREIMYIEAFKVLGMRADEAFLEQEVKDMLDPNISGKGTQKRGIRNFIANNVIESDRFKYLVRYGNVNKLKGIAKNRAVVSFVLLEIPDAQVVRYYNSITGWDEDFKPSMREFLADRLTGFSFEDISDVRQNDDSANQQEQEEKRQKQALVRLYLAVLYLALKNLVYVNSRYFLAFHCVERDRKLIDPRKWKVAEDCGNKFRPEYSFRAFAVDFLRKYSLEYKALEENPSVEAPQYPQMDSSLSVEEKRAICKQQREVRRKQEKLRVARYLKQNMDNSDDWAINVFRNKVEHLDAIRNAGMYLDEIRKVESWYSLFHYIMQRRIMNQYDWDSTHKSKIPGFEDQMICSSLSGKTERYFRWINEKHCYSKDFVKALCVPFAYNLPRYKNLTIDALFDRNRPGESGKTDAMAEEGEEA